MGFDANKLKVPHMKEACVTVNEAASFDHRCFDANIGPDATVVPLVMCSAATSCSPLLIKLKSEI